MADLSSDWESWLRFDEEDNTYCNYVNRDRSWMRMKRIVSVAAIVLSIVCVYVMSSCATQPQEVQEVDSQAHAEKTGKQAPQWVEVTPADTREYTYFVGRGTSENGQRKEAREEAVKALLDEIINSLDVRITEQTPEKAKNALREFRTALSKQLSVEPSKAGESVVMIKDHWFAQQNSGVTAYLLAQYEKEALEQVKTRIKSLFSNSIESTTAAEQEGDTFFDAGSFYQAALQYVKAAAAALSSDDKTKETTNTRFERNIAKAKNALSNIYLLPLNHHLKTYAGQPFQDPFLLKITTEEGREGPGLPGIPIRITYREKNANNRLETARRVVESDDEGVVAFTRPPPEFVGSEKIIMNLDLHSHMQLLEEVPDHLTKHVVSLQELIDSKKVRFQYTSLSRAQDIPTGILISEVDRAGNSRESSDSAEGVMERLSEAGFDIRIMPLEIPVNALQDKTVIKRAQEEYGDRVDRLIFGVMQIADFSDHNGNYIVEVRGTLKVAELKTEQIIYSAVKSKRTRGGNIRSAMSAAFKALGREFGEDMSANLP
jgi:hypothetical protein